MKKLLGAFVVTSLFMVAPIVEAAPLFVPLTPVIVAARVANTPNLDANRDGKITQDDYYYIQGNVSAGRDRLTPEVLQACDLNGDGVLNPSDFMDYKQQFGLYDNPPLASNQKPKLGNAYPNGFMEWIKTINFMGLV